MLSDWIIAWLYRATDVPNKVISACMWLTSQMNSVVQVKYTLPETTPRLTAALVCCKAQRRLEKPREHRRTTNCYWNKGLVSLGTWGLQIYIRQNSSSLTTSIWECRRFRLFKWAQRCDTWGERQFGRQSPFCKLGVVPGMVLGADVRVQKEISSKKQRDRWYLYKPRHEAVNCPQHLQSRMRYVKKKTQQQHLFTSFVLGLVTWKESSPTRYKNRILLLPLSQYGKLVTETDLVVIVLIFFFLSLTGSTPFYVIIHKAEYQVSVLYCITNSFSR